MAVKSKNSTGKTVTKLPPTLSCSRCGELKSRNEFYVSYHAIHKATQRYPYCKDCMQQMTMETNGNISMDKVKETLKLIDRPFLYDYWKSAVQENPENPFGVYMKNLAIKQNRELTWSSSQFDPETVKAQMANADVDNLMRIEDFVLTDEILERWNYGYEREEYFHFEKKYRQLKNNYTEKTAMHTEALLKYIRYSVKEERATSRGETKEAKDWGSLAKEAATAAKINPSQLSAADLSGGMSTFGQLSRAVEQAVDVISILPRFKEKPQDKVDFTLWRYIDYVRDLKGLPHCEYKDIYEFYERRKEEYGKHIVEDEDSAQDEDLIDTVDEIEVDIE